MSAKRLFCLIPWLLTAQAVLVPFVGCPADGQAGPIPAPKGDSKQLAIGPGVARMLAYYSSEFGGGVLGPRGWHCSERYGSSGWTLLIVPPAIGPEPRLARGAGSAIVLDEHVGDTSGRIFVAKVIARMFPVYDWFIARVRNLEEYPPENLPSGPYPKDRLTNRTDSSVEFETPPGNEGLGTLGGNAKSDYTTRGIVMVRGRNDTPNVIQLSVRLPATLSGLTPEIISQLKREHPASTR